MKLLYCLEIALHGRKWPVAQGNELTRMNALLAANGLRSLGSKIRKRQIVRNANADLPPDFCYHPLN